MSDTAVVLGLDPGAQGALCWRPKIIRTDNRRVYRLKEFGELKKACSDFYGLPDIILFKEAVHGQRGDFVNTTFTFGYGTGFQVGFLSAALHPTIIETNPQVWQRAFGLGAKYANTTARKNAHKKVAQALCPELKVTLDMADAILIAEYGWRTIYGDLKK